MKNTGKTWQESGVSEWAPIVRSEEVTKEYLARGKNTGIIKNVNIMEDFQDSNSTWILRLTLKRVRPMLNKAFKNF